MLLSITLLLLVSLCHRLFLPLLHSHHIYPYFSRLCLHLRGHFSVRKPEIQALGTFVLGRCDIFHSFPCTHCIPYSISLLVTENIVCFNKVEKDNIETTDPQQHFVSSSICPCISTSFSIFYQCFQLTKWLIIVAIDIGRNNITRLHKHVIQRRRNRPCPHCV